MQAASAWLDSLSVSVPHLHLSPPPLLLSLFFSLWWGDYGQSGSWAQVSLPPGPMGCGTMTLLKFLQVLCFGEASQRGKAKARLSLECSCQSSLRLPGPARGLSCYWFNNAWKPGPRCWLNCVNAALWLARIPHLNLHLLQLQQLSGYLALLLIDGWGVGVNKNISRIIASDW